MFQAGKEHVQRPRGEQGARGRRACEEVGPVRPGRPQEPLCVDVKQGWGRGWRPGRRLRQEQLGDVVAHTSWPWRGRCFGHLGRGQSQ